MLAIDPFILLARSSETCVSVIGRVLPTQGGCLESEPFAEFSFRESGNGFCVYVLFYTPCCRLCRLCVDFSQFSWLSFLALDRGQEDVPACCKKAAELLKGYKATSHWSVRHVLAGFGARPIDDRVVRDGNRILGAGVTGGLDFGLTMVAELRDRTYAECCQLMSEYDPDPPFNAGSMKTAPPEVKAPMVQLPTDFVKKSEALAAETKG